MAESTIEQRDNGVTAALDRVVEQLATVTQRLAALDTRVVHEPRVYALDSPNSWYHDLTTLSTPATDAGAAHEKEQAEARMAEYARELGRESAAGSAEGRRVDRIIQARTRCHDKTEHRHQTLQAVRELRSLGTGGGATASATSGASVFVSPYFIFAAAGPYRAPVRVFADQCANFPLPPYGMHAYIPYFSSTDKVLAQTEGGAVTEASPSTSFEGNEVTTATGQVVMTQQFRDRYSGGGTADVLISQELNWRLDERIDIVTLAQAVANATIVTGAGAYTEAALWKDLAAARESLADTAGTRLRATSMFTLTDLYGFVTRQVDKTTERPIWPPWYATAFPLVADTDSFAGPNWPQYARYMGTVMPGDVVWLTDDNIPAVGTTTQSQIIVSAPAVAMVLLEDEAVTTAFAETKANELLVILNLRKYIAPITRHAAGTATIQGAAYVTTEK